jgi:CHAD domain-containing protein
MLAQGGKQMTTDRTAIRRWLSVGGGTHRPPWRVRKARHRTIVAPLAASAAIGLGVALARAGVERRSRRASAGTPELGLKPDERLGPGLRRMALEQADLVLAQLADAGPADAGAQVHEARKAIKRLRTIVRVLEGALGSDSCAFEQDALRAAAAPLGVARDAAVMAATLDELVRRHKKRLSGRAGVQRLRVALATEREQAARMLSAEALFEAHRQVVGFRARAERWQLSEAPELDVAAAGLRRVYRQGRRRNGRAAGKQGSRMRTMHQWRKRVKDLRYAAEALARPMSPASRPKGKKARRQAREQARWLRQLAKRADALGEVLGEEHDLAVLGEWIALHGAPAGVGRGTRRRLSKLIVRRRRKLRRRALRAGRQLYRRRPKRFLARVGRAHRASLPKLSRR